MRPSPVGLSQTDDTRETSNQARGRGLPAGLCSDELFDRVLDAWDNATGDAIDEEDVKETLQAVVQALSDSKPDQGVVDPKAKTALGRRLLQLIRRDILNRLRHESADNIGPAAVIDLMATLDAVQEALEPDWSEYFVSRLSGPDGLDLVVEVAHDLRSPLTSILFLAETLQRGQSGEVNELQHRQLGLIYSAGLGLSSLASNVIELARGGDKLVDDERQPCSLTEILESVRDIVRPIAEEKGLSIRIQPPVTDQRLGNPIALSRVLLNLTTNALKFTDEGYVELTAVALDMTRVEFGIRDTGAGIKPQAAANMYQPFRRAVGREGYRFSGTGLGLTISRKLVEAMGSTLKLETRANWGTRFHFLLDMPPAAHG